MKDYLSAVDFMKEKPYVDSRYIGATGASYGRIERHHALRRKYAEVIFSVSYKYGSIPFVNILVGRLRECSRL